MTLETSDFTLSDFRASHKIVDLEEASQVLWGMGAGRFILYESLPKCVFHRFSYFSEHYYVTELNGKFHDSFWQKELTSFNTLEAAMINLYEPGF